MKIGILTLPLHTNYGGILQAYALQTVLERMGHEVVEVELNRKLYPYPPIWKLPLSFGKRFLLKYICHRKEQKIFVEKYQRECTRYVRDFIQTHVRQMTVNHLSECKGLFDVMICGSDQIWRYKYYPYFEDDIGNLYLKFLADDKCKRIAYAASFGTEEWEYPPKETEECRKYVHLFKNISVRESSGVELCKEHFGITARHVLDPTMLLEKKDYVNIIKQSGVECCDGKMFCYILDKNEQKEQIINHIYKKRLLKPFYMSGDLKNQVQPPVETWLRAFQNSELIVTDSFHACVFSILFHKQFVVIGNKERGMARINSLLALLGLEERLVSDKNKFVDAMGLIDYEEVDKLLNNFRQKSFDFLVSSLK